MNIYKIIFSVLGVILAVAIIFRFRLYLQGRTLKVTSWWRSPWHNIEVGGINYSKHLIGWAFDITPVNDITGRILKNMGFARIINENTHYHVEIF